MLCCALVRRPLTHEGSRKSACWVALGLSFPFCRVRSGSKTIPGGLQVRERGRGDVFAANKNLRSGLLVTAGGICGFNPLALPCRLLRARWLTGAAKDTSRVARSAGQPGKTGIFLSTPARLRGEGQPRRRPAGPLSPWPGGAQPLTSARRRSASHLGGVLRIQPPGKRFWKSTEPAARKGTNSAEAVTWQPLLPPGRPDRRCTR